MSADLFIAGGGAVTPAGLDLPQTLAAIRAGLSPFSNHLVAEPFGVAQTVARIPSDWHLRRTAAEWLANMAARALGEAMATGSSSPEATAILMAQPESFRGHPAFEGGAYTDLFGMVIRATGQTYHRASRAIDSGAAAGIGLLGRVSELLQRGDVEQVLLGGVDSLVNDIDIARLSSARRLKAEDNAQGLVPGEGAVFVRLTKSPPAGEPVGTAIFGFGVAREENSVLSEKYSQGRAQLAAMQDAVSGGGPREPDINFVVSNGNGERYLAWEQMIARPRFFRTRREILPTAYPAMTVGDVGAAGGALTLLLAADSFRTGYAPGKVALCEVSSESGLRAAAVVAEVRRG